MATSSGSFGRYQLLDGLGRGGTGEVCEVFRAFDTETDRVVAIKLLAAHLADNPEYRQRFEREAHTAAGLNDPHIVPIHSYGEIDGRLYADMSLIEGHDLGALLAGEGGRLHPARAVAITEHVASALDSAHRAGLVHRDVKPSNILVGERDFTYLTDFGIAPFTSTDSRADIYALTCVLHECLTGQRNLPPPQPSTTWPDIPPAFDAVIARGTAENPDERYQTATQLADAARAALTGSPVTAAGPWPQAPTEFIPQPIQEWPAEPAAATAPKPASRSVRARVANNALVLLVMLILAYLVTVVVAAHDRPKPGIDQLGGIRMRLTALTPPDGSTPSQDALSEAQRVIASRVEGLGISGAQVVVDGDGLVVTVPGSNGEQISGIGQTGRFYIRPVINSVPTQSSAPAAPPQGSPGNRAERIADEKKWRQSTSQSVQLLGLQLQATRCNLVDVLAGNDDPNLPLVTCSTDHKTAYLLAPSILGNDQIDRASSGSDEGRNLVELKFTADGAKTWADYTAVHIGSQVAFTLDTQVLTAPVFQEAITIGRTQISGGLTATQARDLANILNHKSLPLNFERSELQTVPPKPGAAAGLMSRLLSPPAVVIAVAIGLLLILICLLLYSNYPRIRARLGRGG